MTEQELLLKISRDMAGLTVAVEGLCDRIDAGDRRHARTEKMILGDGHEQMGLSARLTSIERSVRIMAKSYRWQQVSQVSSRTNVICTVITVVGTIAVACLAGR